METTKQLPIAESKTALKPYRVWAEIDLAQIRKNLAEVKKFLKPETKILAVLKADAYGHGAVPIANALSREIDYIGVGDSEEALELRNAGIETPILILGAIVPGEIPRVINADISVCVHSSEQALTLNEQAGRLNKRLKVHLMVDTGMGRLGVSYTQAASVLRTLKECENLFTEGIASHFSSASEKNRVFTHSQLERFFYVLNKARDLGIHPELVHIANSAAVANHDVAHFSMIRAGLSLLGVNPGYNAEIAPAISPVLTLRTQIIHIKRAVPQGTPISYDRRFYTPRPSDIATLPIGYNDGLRRILSSPSPTGRISEVLVRNQRVPIVGTITMDYTMIDVSGIPDASVGDEVTIIGRAGDKEIKVEEVAENALTIPYDIFCGLSKRVVRLYRLHENEPFRPYSNLS